MIQAYLDGIREAAAEIAIQYTNGRIEAAFTGNGDYNDIFNDSMRVHYLLGAIDSVYLVADVPYIGGTAVTDSYVKSLSNKIWHYNGVFRDVNLEDYDAIVPDDGDGGSVDSVGAVVVDNDMRIGELAVGVGANVVTFYLGGVPTPFPNTSYQVDAWLITNSGYMQRQVVVSNKLANGFTVEDILEAGVLHYQATLNT